MVPHPPRFSPEDKYLVYRYRMKLAAGLVPPPKGEGEGAEGGSP